MTNWFKLAVDICHGIRKDRKFDAEIAAEIEAIEAEPVNLSDYNPEDWLPTGEERERLLEDE